MMRVSAIVALVGVLAAPAPPGVAQANLSGEWRLASATANRTRNGEPGERPVRQYVSTGSAFNCGRECRIVHKGSTLTVENAQLKADATAPSPTVTIVVDGRSHAVVDSLTPGRTIETVSRWEDGKLVITSMLLGIPMTQTVSLEQNQLVVVKSYVTDPGAKFTLRYTKKQRPPRVSYLSVASQRSVNQSSTAWAPGALCRGERSDAVWALRALGGAAAVGPRIRE